MADTASSSRFGDQRALLRLMAWLSPAFPVGGFAYSGGLESAVAERHVRDVTSLNSWLALLLEQGGLRNDAILFIEAHRRQSEGGDLGELVELAAALAGSAERHAEITRQGEAFVTAAAGWPHPVLGRLSGPVAYGVAVGAIAAAHGVAAGDALAAFLHAQVSMLVSVAIRLGVIGQSHGVALIAEFEGRILAAVPALEQAGLEDLGSAAIAAETLSMRHETQYSRLFQS
ncbi:urease accessory protein UreF [Rhizobium sp. Root274]|uniref:urease accessory protein UreF n=1 Tax=unclassified Rhizobium TaxID=2613769 RepID=UPI000715CC37|nr:MULTISPECIES: urease accessory UreF family protein [unclassified Rhizobium]KQW29750.1 urease accessory protein UreF [Rhizobium sp. Root1240]KRD29940.1 urease accessory protein UreF [Rhizobium sp. Root274]